MIKSSLAVAIGLISILWTTSSQAQVYYPINARQPAPATVVYQSLRPVVIGPMPVVPARVYRAPIYQTPVYQAVTYSAPVVEAPTVQTVQRPVVTGSWQPVTSFRPTIIPSSPTVSTRFYDAPVTVQRPIYQSPSQALQQPQFERQQQYDTPQYRTQSSDRTISLIQSQVDRIEIKMDTLLDRMKEVRRRLPPGE